MNSNRSNLKPKQRRLGFLAGLFLGHGRKDKLNSRQLHQKDVSTSTQKMGIRFSDKLRDAFRHRWMKIR